MKQMETLDSKEEAAIETVAHRHGFSVDAARTMLDAIVRGNGSMAQFSHPEFGGSGQWMRGGMTMVADLFNNRLKTAVDGLCVDLAKLAAGRSVPAHSGSFQSQRQDGAEPAYRSANDPGGSAEPGRRPSMARAAGQWWPAELGRPNASGSQNGARYAYFAGPRRLAIENDGGLTIYDTESHQISGVSQQQSGSGTISFSSQHGPVDLNQLAVVSEPPARAASDAAPAPVTSRSVDASLRQRAGGSQDIPSLIGQLAALHSAGVLTDAEFGDKKAELLRRI